jgi:hypothetical protein
MIDRAFLKLCRGVSQEEELIMIVATYSATAGRGQEAETGRLTATEMIDGIEYTVTLEPDDRGCYHEVAVEPVPDQTSQHELPPDAYFG